MVGEGDGTGCDEPEAPGGAAVDGIGDGEPAEEASGTGGPDAGAAPGCCGIGEGPEPPICEPTCGMEADPTCDPTCGAGPAAALGAGGMEAGP